MRSMLLETSSYTSWTLTCHTVLHIWPGKRTKNTNYTRPIRIMQGLQMNILKKNVVFALENDLLLISFNYSINFKLGSSKLLSALGDCSLQPICPLKQKPTALQGTTSLKTNMTGWKISMFKEMHLHTWWIFYCHLSFGEGNISHLGKGKSSTQTCRNLVGNMLGTSRAGVFFYTWQTETFCWVAVVNHFRRHVGP